MIRVKLGTNDDWWWMVMSVAMMAIEAIDSHGTRRDFRVGLGVSSLDSIFFGFFLRDGTDCIGMMAAISVCIIMIDSID